MKVADILQENDKSILLQDLMAQFKNMKTFMPESPEQLQKALHKDGKAYRGIAQDIIKIVNQMEKAGMV